MVRLGQQPSLFGETALGIKGDPKNDLLDWSPSKRDVLNQCPRRYYYQYYGASSRFAADESQKGQLQFYRKFSNSWMLAGILLHAKIRQEFKALKDGAPNEPEELVKAFNQRWERVREASVQFVRSGDVNATVGKVLLLEFVFEDPEAESMWSAAGERLGKALTGFMTLPSLERFRKGGLTYDAAIEKRVKVDGQGFCMRGQIDLAWKEDGRVTVADWKSSSRDSGDSDLQLLVYALAVQQHFNCQLSELDLFRVELDSGRIVRQDVNEQEAARARARMAQDTRLMMDLDKYGQQGVAEAFTPTGSKRICRLCPYQRICPGSEA
jgi:hypothetical protein